MKPTIKFALLFIAVCVFVSCKANAAIDNSDKFGTRPNRVKLDVIHILQRDDYSCAPTSVAMAISYFEKTTLDKNEVWKISQSSISKVQTYGNDMEGLTRIAKHYGYESQFLEGLSIDDLEELLSKGIPVVINLLRPNGKNIAHAVLVVGFDRKKQTLFINDPARSVVGKSITYKKLNELWSAHLSRPNRWAFRSGFIVYPKK